jgi:hypothetical protein
VLANNRTEHAELDGLHRRGRANGVDLILFTEADAKRIGPRLRIRTLRLKEHPTSRRRIGGSADWHCCRACRSAANQAHTPFPKEETIMKAGSPLNSVAERIAQVARSTREFLARPAQVRLSPTAGNRTTSLTLDDGTGALSFGISEVVHHQVASFLDIPMSYYERMRQLTPDLLAQNANAWFQRSPGRRLVRTALDDDSRPQVRAFLSDRYRPLDNAQLLEAVLPQLSAQGTRIVSAELTEKKLYVKAVTERVTTEVRAGDVVMAGVVISNSEIGFGALAIQPLVYTLKCENGLIAGCSQSKPGTLSFAQQSPAAMYSNQPRDKSRSNENCVRYAGNGKTSGVRCLPTISRGRSNAATITAWISLERLPRLSNAIKRCTETNSLQLRWNAIVTN